eukprot:jgi/Bigna1/67374/fgenesh1_pg.3_\
MSSPAPSSSSPSRLERLLKLLEDAPSASARLAASNQIAELCPSRFEESVGMILRVVPYLKSANWDTRVAAGRVLEGIARKFSGSNAGKSRTVKSEVAEVKSSGFELEAFDISLALQQPPLLADEKCFFNFEPINLSHHFKEYHDGMKTKFPTGYSSQQQQKTNPVSSSSLVASGSNNRPPVKMETERPGNTDIPSLDETKQLSARERAVLRRQRKRKAGAADLSVSSSNASSSTRAKLSNRKRGRWDMIHPNWEFSQGAGIGLRSLLRFAPRRQQYGVKTEDGEEVAREDHQWILEVSFVLLGLLTLDKFADHAGEIVVAPVRETAAQALGLLCLFCPRSCLDWMWHQLETLTTARDWSSRFTGFLGIKYLLAVRPDFLAASVASVKSMGAALRIYEKGLKDKVEDVRGECAVKSGMYAVIVSSSPKTRDLDELSAASATIIPVIAKIYNNNNATSKGHATSSQTARSHRSTMELLSMLPRLYPFVTHTMESVALSTVKSINDALISISSPAALSPTSSQLQGSIAATLREAWILLVQSAIFDQRPNVASASMAGFEGLILRPWSSINQNRCALYTSAFPRLLRISETASIGSKQDIHADWVFGRGKSRLRSNNDRGGAKPSAFTAEIRFGCLRGASTPVISVIEHMLEGGSSSTVSGKILYALSLTVAEAMRRYCDLREGKSGIDKELRKSSGVAKPPDLTKLHKLLYQLLGAKELYFTEMMPGMKRIARLSQALMKAMGNNVFQLIAFIPLLCKYMLYAIRWLVDRFCSSLTSLPAAIFSIQAGGGATNVIRAAEITVAACLSDLMVHLYLRREGGGDDKASTNLKIISKVSGWIKACNPRIGGGGGGVEDNTASTPSSKKKGTHATDKKIDLADDDSLFEMVDFHETVACGSARLIFERLARRFGFAVFDAMPSLLQQASASTLLGDSPAGEKLFQARFCSTLAHSSTYPRRPYTQPFAGAHNRRQLRPEILGGIRVLAVLVRAVAKIEIGTEQKDAAAAKQTMLLRARLVRMLPGVCCCLRVQDTSDRFTAIMCLTTYSRHLLHDAIPTVLSRLIMLINDQGDEYGREGACTTIGYMLTKIDQVDDAQINHLPTHYPHPKKENPNVIYWNAGMELVLPYLALLLLRGRKMAPFELPVKKNANLRNYQQAGVDWLHFLYEFNLHGALCDDMGLGKTLRTICIIASASWKQLRSLSSSSSSSSTPASLPLITLIVCPATLVAHCVKRINLEPLVREQDNFRPLCTRSEKDSAIQRAQQRQRAGKCSALIVSYGTLARETGRFLRFNFVYIVLNEGHVIKNPKSSISKQLKTLRSKHRLILSGTPIQNRVLDLWSLFDFLMPGYLGTQKSFNARFSRPVQMAAKIERKRRGKGKLSKQEQETIKKGSEALIALKRQVGGWLACLLRGVIGDDVDAELVLPFVLRRVKEDVLKELPPKIIQDIYVDPSQLQDAYKRDTHIIAAQHLSTQATFPFQQMHFHWLGAYARTRRLCSALKKKQQQDDSPCHPALLDAKDSIAHAPKLAALRQLLVNFCGMTESSTQETDKSTSMKRSAAEEASSLLGRERTIHRPLIFAQLKETLDLIQDKVLKRYFPEASFVRIDGSVDPRERVKVAERFNQDPSVDLVLLTTSVGGLGLNLQGADTVIFIEHDWNPTNDLQAMDRAHRIGQKKVVNVYRLLVRNTLEMDIMSLQRFKTYVAKSVISANKGELAKAQTGEVLDLFQTAADGVEKDHAKQERSKKKDSSSSSKASSGLGSMTNMLNNLDELWDESQYEDQFDLTAFLKLGEQKRGAR